MEIKQFQDSRNTQLDEFEKGYNFLKTQYSSSVLAAIQESDPAAQQQLISKILEINSELSDQVRNILTELNKGQDSFNPKTLEDLTADLINYQQQYQEIQKNKDKLQTLKLIYSSSKQKLQDTTTMYNIYLGVLILLTFVVVFLVFKTAWSSVASTVTSTVQAIGGRR